MSDDSLRAARAAERRRTWTGGVARSFAEMDAADLAFWQAATPSERIHAVTLLIDDLSAESTGFSSVAMQWPSTHDQGHRAR